MKANDSFHRTSGDALGDIRRHKEKVSKRLMEHELHIKSVAKNLFAPPPKAATKMGIFLNAMEQGMVIYDGALLGLRAVRNIRNAFGRKKKK